MKRILLFFITIFSASLFAQLSFDYESSGQILPNSEGVSQIDLPVTFDASGIDYTMGDFGGNVSTLIVDPTDASNSVMQVVKTQGAETWAGTTIGTATGFATAIPFTASNSKMSVRVWSPSSGLPIRLKVEDANDPTHTCETETNTTVANAWDTLTFDFGQQAPGTEPLSTGLSNGWVFNKASIFFNFGTGGDTEMTFYFDDVNHLVGGGTPNPLSQIDLPVSFEDTTVDYSMSDFGGNVSTLIVDPTDASNSVMQVVKTQGAETWAGTTIGTATGFATAIPFTASNSKMSVRVWSPLADLPIRLKVENADSANHSCETEASTIVANGWQTLVFDFDQQAPGTEPLSTGLSNGWVFNKASIFFNFGAAADTEMTFYFDDVELGGIIGISDIGAQINIYPNPTNTHWQITSHEVIEEVVLVDVLGKVVARYPVQTNTVSINAMSFDSGMYIANIRTASGSFNEVLLRR